MWNLSIYRGHLCNIMERFVTIWCTYHSVQSQYLNFRTMVTFPLFWEVAPIAIIQELVPNKLGFKLPSLLLPIYFTHLIRSPVNVYSSAGCTAGSSTSIFYTMYTSIIFNPHQILSCFSSVKLNQNFYSQSVNSEKMFICQTQCLPPLRTSPEPQGTNMNYTMAAVHWMNRGKLFLMVSSHQGAH